MTESSTAKATDVQRMWLATFLVTAFVACILILFLKTVPPENKDLITYMIGQLSGMATMALGFYFVNKAGQDALDSQKAENTGKMADAITAAANSTSSTNEAAQRAADETAEAARQRADEYKPLKFEPPEENKP